MSKDKKVAEPKTVEDVKKESSPELTSRQEIEKMIAGNEEVIEGQDNEESQDEQVDESNDETESDTSADEQEDSDVGDTEDSDDESEEVSDDADTDQEDSGEDDNPIESMVNEHLDKDEKKDGKQKRIDKLTAVNSSLQEQLEAAKAQLQEIRLQMDTIQSKPKTTEVDGVKYTDEQLKKALKQAVEDDDTDLQFEIMVEMRKQAKVEAYEEFKRNTRNPDQERLVKEIEETRNAYSYLGETPLYEGSEAELNLNDPGSLLVQTAEYLYKLPKEKVGDKYTGPGGITACVRDALKIILNARRGKSPEKENKLLKKKVNKNGRKNSVRTGTKVKSDKGSSKPKSSDELFKEELQRRASMGSTIMS